MRELLAAFHNCFAKAPKTAFPPPPYRVLLFRWIIAVGSTNLTVYVIQRQCVIFEVVSVFLNIL